MALQVVNFSSSVIKLNKWITELKTVKSDNFDLRTMPSKSNHETLWSETWQKMSYHKTSETRSGCSYSNLRWNWPSRPKACETRPRYLNFKTKFKMPLKVCLIVNTGQFCTCSKILYNVIGNQKMQSLRHLESICQRLPFIHVQILTSGIVSTHAQKDHWKVWNHLKVVQKMTQVSNRKKQLMT